jgi:anti-anti-sigma factor
MAFYRVTLPHRDPVSGAMRHTTVEVEGESEAEARRLALAEFAEMAGLGSSQTRPSVIERDIRVERAPVARRSTLEITKTTLPGGVVCIRLAGSLNAANFERLQEALDGAGAGGARRLVLDLGGLTYVNSTGMSLFVAASDLFDLRLAAVPERISRLFRMVGLDQLCPSYASVSEAASAATQGAGPAG